MRYLLSIIVFCILYVNTFAQQTIDETYVYQDSLRQYKLYIPQAYLDNPNVEVPLLFNLHGYGSDNWQQNLYADFKPIANQENFIICLPNGTHDMNGDRFWNAGFGADVDDVGFISSLIDTISNNYSINDQKIYSTGMSNGGYMSLTLACELNDRIKKVASVTGSMTPLQENNCSSTSAIPVLQISGTTDATVSYNPSATQIGAEAVVDFWVTHNGCDAIPVLTAVPNTNTQDGCTAERYDYGTCDDNTAVVFYKIINGGHTWPGSGLPFAGINTNQDFKATEVIWKFFEPSYEPVSILNVVKNDFEVSLYPNPSTNRLIIDLPNNTDFQKAEFYSLAGQFIFATQNKKIDLSKIDKGIYICKIYSSKGIATQKITKL